MDAPIQHEAASGDPRRVFLCGTARGGTTLLAGLLDGHPSLAVLPGDTRIWPVLMDRTLGRGVVRAAAALDRPGLTALLGLPGVWRLAFRDRRALEARLARWLEDLPGPPVDARSLAAHVACTLRRPADFWGAFFEAFFAVAGTEMAARPIRVEKTPLNELLVPLLGRLFGARTRWVHVVRDPRAVVASWLAMRTPPPARRRRAILDRCVDWSRSAHRALRASAEDPERYRALRYEDLVAAPAQVMAGVASFLGIAWNDTLRTPTRLGVPWAPNSSFEDARRGAPGAVLDRQTGRFGEILVPDEVGWIEAVLGTQMVAWGYAPGVPSSEPGKGPHAPGGARGMKGWLKGFELARRQRAHRTPPAEGVDRTWEHPLQRSR